MLDTCSGELQPVSVIIRTRTEPCDKAPVPMYPGPPYLLGTLGTQAQGNCRGVGSLCHYVAQYEALWPHVAQYLASAIGGVISALLP